MTDTTSEAPHAAALHHLDALRRGMADLMFFLADHPEAPTPSVIRTEGLYGEGGTVHRGQIKSGTDVPLLAVSLGAQPEVQTYGDGSRYLDLNRDFGPVRYKAWLKLDPSPRQVDEVVPVSIDDLPDLSGGES